MNSFNDYALLFAVALPVVIIVGIQVSLFIAGERGTGLIPGFGSYPSIAFGRSEAQVFEMPKTAATAPIGESSNDETERLAA